MLLVVHIKYYNMLLIIRIEYYNITVSKTYKKTRKKP